MSTGDGGMITTLKEETAVAIRKFGCLGYKSLKASEGRVRSNKDIFQNPNYSRHDDIGLNYRMSEFQAAVGLAQLEKLDYFIALRRNIANSYREILKDCNFLLPQKVDNVDDHAYWTYAVRFTHDKISWEDFRLKFIENGGSGIYAAWKLLYQEDVFTNGNWKKRSPDLYKDYHLSQCVNAEVVQKEIMQFPLNDSSVEAASINLDALYKTIREFS